MKRYQADYASYQHCQKMANEALIAKSWINIKKAWYTPAEFLEVAKKEQFTFGEIKIRDPRESFVIQRMDRVINGMQYKRDEFAEKIKKYYYNH